jgi:putative AlgH/UPF0301 family transcriptional regulator
MSKKYQGHLLIANPSNPYDDLSRSVILVATHANNIAVGLQINLEHTEINLSDVAQKIGILLHTNDPLYYGGSMNISKIHVVHSLDWRGLGTVALNKELGITNDISILTDIADGQGPMYYKACAGYWFWDNGRLDAELNPRNTELDLSHKWETIPADIDNVFETAVEEMWPRSIKSVAQHKVNAWF